MKLNKFYIQRESVPINELQALEALEDGRIRTPEFWDNPEIVTKLFDTKALSHKLSLMFPVLDRVFPELWEVYWEGSLEGLSPVIGIYYPEFTVSNYTKETSYESKGLMATLSFNTDAALDDYYTVTDDGEDWEPGTPNFDPNIRGFKTHYKFLEFVHGYVHSHVNTLNKDTSNPFETRKFCLGSSEILETFVAVDEAYHPEEPEDFESAFEMLCYMVTTHVETESSEGGPYKYFSDLVDPGQELFRRENSNFSLKSNNILKKIKEAPGFDYYFDGSKYVVKNNQKFRDKVKKYCLDYDASDMLIVVASDGNEYRFASRTQVRYTDSRTRFLERNKDTNDEQAFTLLRGQKIYLTVELPEHIDNDIENAQVAKPFLNYFKNLYEEFINKKLIENETIRTYNKAYFERAYNGKDTIFV